jgi:hypothetical protein
MAVDSGPVFLPVMPAAIPAGPLPWGSRHVFDADSIRFSGALTLADLLVRIPGVFVARGGFYGQAEPVFYAGRGASGIEVYWDGVPLRPLGRDSLYLDVGRIPVTPLDRVEVQRWPDRIRVDLITTRAGDTAPRTAIGITTGDLNVSDYRAAYARRWRWGLGIYMVADFAGTDGDAGSSTEFHGNDLWMKLEFMPSASVGAAYQILRSSWRRDGRSNLVDPWKMARQDGAFSVFVGSRDDALGWRLQGTITSSGTSGDSLTPNDGVSRSGIELSRRWSRANVSLAGRLANDVVPGEVEGRAGWLVLPWLDIAAQARVTDYLGGRTGRRAGASAGLRLPLGFQARAAVVAASELRAPRVWADSTRATLDWLGALRWDGRWGALEVARAERDAFQPLGFPEGLRPLARLGPTPRTTEITVHGTIRPLPGLELSAWYADPVRGGGDFEPPRHARYAATFFSRFWRKFKSGVFALRAEAAAESWSRGLGGIAQDSTGATSQVVLPGATFFDLHVEIQIVGATLFWQMRNAAAMRAGFVNGLGYPGIVQIYGARWSFLN